jgi:hypothetical protein
MSWQRSELVRAALPEFSGAETGGAEGAGDFRAAGLAKVLRFLAGGFFLMDLRAAAGLSQPSSFA